MSLAVLEAEVPGGGDDARRNGPPRRARCARHVHVLGLDRRRRGDGTRTGSDPGQINMIGISGVGEVPISVSSDPASPRTLAHTIRSCGRVTNVFKALRRGDHVTIRGPFGRPWPVARAQGGDMLVVAGGLGLAPVRPAIYHAIRHRNAFRRLIVLVGARGPEHMLFADELDVWRERLADRGIELMLTVDVGDEGWPYDVGVVTTLFPRANIDPARDDRVHLRARDHDAVRDPRPGGARASRRSGSGCRWSATCIAP